MKRYEAYLFDLDGTLYRGDEPVPHASEVLRELRGSGARVGFLTNNSGTTPGRVVDKLAALGFESYPEEVVTSGMAASDLVRELGHRRLFAVGEPGLVETLRGAGLHVANAGDDGVVGCGATGTVDAVVCGICRSFTYALLDASLQQLLSGAGFIATNPDATYPLEGGRLQPGAGSLVAALKTCAGRAPTVAGKPAPRMVEMALRTLGVRPQRALVVGDRPDTDLAAGQAAGCDAVLVLTGVTRNAPTDQSAIEDLRGLLR